MRRCKQSCFNKEYDGCKKKKIRVIRNWNIGYWLLMNMAKNI